MDADTMRGFEDFQRVWERVTVGESEKKDARETLEGLMAAEERSAAFYEALSRRCLSAAKELKRMAEEEREHLAALRVEYYLLTGDSYAPPESCPLVTGILASLRSAHEAEQRAEKSYAKAAEETDCQRLRDTYLRHAVAERSHAGTLRSLIARALG